MRQLKITNKITSRESLALDKYLSDISKIDLLKPEEEFELAKRIKAGDQEALAKLTNANLRFVVSVAKQYQNHGLSLSDLINEGNVGLMKAARRFDETKGFKFISYAVWWIRQSILKAILEYSRLVRLPLNKVNLLSKIREVRTSFIQEFEREPSATELAEALDLTPKEVEDAIENSNTPVSFDAPLNNEEGESGTMLDVYLEKDGVSPDMKLMKESLKNEMEAGLSELSPRESEVLDLYFGLSGNRALNLDDIGDRLGLTRERVRQVKERALRRLRRKINKVNLRSYLS